MAKEIAFENGQISIFEGLMTLTLDQVILHNIMHHSHRPLTTCQISLKSKKLLVERRTDVGTDGRTFETGFIRSTLSKSRPKNPQQISPINLLLQTSTVNKYACSPYYRARCMPITLHAAPDESWWMSTPTGQTDGWTPDRYTMLSARCSCHDTNKDN